jgi:hypothetical protein
VEQQEPMVRQSPSFFPTIESTYRKEGSEIREKNDWGDGE